MESSGCVSKAKRHNNEFVGAIARGKSSFVFVSEANRDLMIARVEIEFSEVVSACEAVMEVVDAWDGEIVLSL